MYYIYMLRCVDDSLYTGITTDLERRFREHKSKDKKCARYTLNHTVLNIECAWITESKSLASKLEFYLKHLPKKAKEEIIKYNSLDKYLAKKVDLKKYERVTEENL